MIAVIKEIENSNICEGLFLELKHEWMKNKIIVGNLYILKRTMIYISTGQ